MRVRGINVRRRRERIIPAHAVGAFFSFSPVGKLISLTL